MSLAEVQPPVGIQMDDVDGHFFARNGNVCEGYVYPLAISQAAAITGDGETLSILPGGTGSIWASVSAATGQAANEGRNGRWVLALQSALDTTMFKGKVKGIARAVVSEVGNAAFARGSFCFPAAIALTGTGAASVGGYHLDAQPMTGTGGVARKAIAQYLGPTYSTTPSDGTTDYVYFDGIDGVGFSGETQ